MPLTQPFADIAKDTTLGLINAKLPALSGGATPVVGPVTNAELRASPIAVAGNGNFAITAQALPLPTGAATDAKLDTVIAALGTPLQEGGNVAVANFPATQAISAASLPLPAGAATQTTLQAILDAFHPEDSPAVSGDLGILALAQRQIADTTSTDADGDYTAIKIDEEGRVKVSSKPASYPDITGDITAVQATIGTPVAGGTVTGDVSRASNVMAFCTGTFAGVNCTFEGSLEASGDANWFGLQAVRTNANTIETTTGVLGAAPAYAWELSVNALRRVRVRATARTSGTQSWRFVQGTYATEPIPAAQVSATQPVSLTSTTVTASTPATPTALNFNSAASTNATVIKATAGTLYGITVTNTGASARFVKLHNSATVTPGTTAVAITIPVAAGASVALPIGPLGHRFATGICMSVTGAAADNDTTAIGANEVKALVSFI